MAQAMMEEDVVLIEVVAWEAGLQALHGRIAHRFRGLPGADKDA